MIRSVGTPDSVAVMEKAGHVRWWPLPLAMSVVMAACVGLPSLLRAADGWPNCRRGTQATEVKLDYWSSDQIVPGEDDTEPWQLSDVVDGDEPAVVSCDACDACGSMVCDTCGPRWFDSAEVFLTGDGWKNIFDDDDNNNFGFRTGFNLGVPLPGPTAVQGQIGASYGAYDFHGRESLLSRDDPIEQQVFVTAGLYKRSDIECGDDLAWGVVYDIMDSRAAGERADRLRLAQMRSYVGLALGEHDEIGVWSAFRLTNDYAVAQRVRVNTTDQVNAFWHRNWQFGSDTVGYVGWADDPGSVVIGLTARAPLNNHFALLGNVHYIVPSTTGGDIHPTLGTDDIFNQEAWNVSFGLVFYPGGKAAPSSVSGFSGLPLLPVADNGSFTFQAPLF